MITSASEERNSFPMDSGEESTDSSVEDPPKKVQGCSHQKKAVDVSKVSKKITSSGFDATCNGCRMEKKKLSEEESYSVDQSIWLCLRCGYQGCGRSSNQHALKHYEVPHSDCHALSINTETWCIWCYECDEFINSTCPKLVEIVNFLRSKKEQLNNFTKVPPTISTTKQPVISALPKYTLTSAISTDDTTRPRGLMNLGNTCFFNSVMQCLAQTPYLLELLDETSQAGKTFQLPGGVIQLDDGHELKLDPLEGTLEGWRHLPQALADTLREMRNGRAENYIPRMLLSALVHRMPQFGGGDQHDAHELLRHLLEAVREEDLKRYQRVVLEKYGFGPRTNPSGVDKDQRKILKFYGQQASEFLLPTEQVFRGVLVSTLQCQECQHTSHRDEFFLDLSLPINEHPMPLTGRRTTFNNTNAMPFTYNSKKTYTNSSSQQPSSEYLFRDNDFDVMNNNTVPDSSGVASSEMEKGVSRHQSKNERRLEKKKFRREQKMQQQQKRTNNLNNIIGNGIDAELVDSSPKHNDDNNGSSSGAGDDFEQNMDNKQPDIEDSIELNLKSIDTISSSTTLTSSLSKELESGYNSGKNTSPDSSTKHCDMPSIDNAETGSLDAPQSPLVDFSANSPLTTFGSQMSSPSSSSTSSETNIDSCGGRTVNIDILEPILTISDRPATDKRDYTHRPNQKIPLGADNYGTVDFVMRSNETPPDTTMSHSLTISNNDRMPMDTTLGIDVGSGEGISNTLADDTLTPANHLELWTDTITTRYQSIDGEMSVQACLNQFTACELLREDNKVCCEVCTKRYAEEIDSSDSDKDSRDYKECGSPDSTSSSSSSSTSSPKCSSQSFKEGGARGGKTSKRSIYSPATKQFLIYNPPAVLILHLKRFQVLRFRSAKVNKYVSFPTELDLAPFCSKRSQGLATVDNEQKQILYSLYGIVEHSGSLFGGHYVAYVKVREKIDKDNYRWRFLPKNQNKQLSAVEREQRIAKMEARSAVDSSSQDHTRSKWYYISDSHVAEVSEQKVLKAQAYLLFYERIF